MNKLVCAKIVSICFLTSGIWDGSLLCIWVNIACYTLFFIFDRLIGENSTWYFLFLWTPYVFFHMTCSCPLPIILWRCASLSFQVISSSRIWKILALCSRTCWKHFLQLFICLLNGLWDLEGTGNLNCDMSLSLLISHFEKSAWEGGKFVSVFQKQGKGHWQMTCLQLEVLFMLFYFLMFFTHL